MTEENRSNLMNLNQIITHIEEASDSDRQAVILTLHFVQFDHKHGKTLNPTSAKPLRFLMMRATRRSPGNARSQNTTNPLSTTLHNPSPLYARLSHTISKSWPFFGKKLFVLSIDPLFTPVGTRLNSSCAPACGDPSSASTATSECSHLGVNRAPPNNDGFRALGRGILKLTRGG